MLQVLCTSGRGDGHCTTAACGEFAGAQQAPEREEPSAGSGQRPHRPEPRISLTSTRYLTPPGRHGTPPLRSNHAPPGQGERPAAHSRSSPASPRPARPGPYLSSERLGHQPGPAHRLPRRHDSASAT